MQPIGVEHPARRSLREVALVFLVFLLAVVVYSQHGFDRKLSKIHGIHLYAGQRMAEGVPPYVSTFNHIPPVGPMLCGLGVMIARGLNWDDVYTVRLLFFLLGCLTPVSVYLLARWLYRSSRIGLFAALIFLGFLNFGLQTASGPQKKTLLILFQTLSLFLTSKERWFWAGVFGSLAALTWQPAAVFPLVTLVLAVAASQVGRLQAVGKTLFGIILPLGVIGAYFLYHGALYDLLDGCVLFNLQYLDRVEISLMDRFIKPVGVAVSGFGMGVMAILVGLLMVLYTYSWRWSVKGPLCLTRDRFAPILLSFPAPVIYSCLDFQSFPDFYIFLPYTAIAFAHFLGLAVERIEKANQVSFSKTASSVLSLGLCAVLVFGAGLEARRNRVPALELQKEAVEEIRRRFGRDVKVVSVNVPQLLVLLHKTSPTRYVFLTSGVDRHIEANVSGGFEGWLQTLQEYDPAVVVHETIKKIRVHGNKLSLWLDGRYRREQIGPWDLYIRKRTED